MSFDTRKTLILRVRNPDDADGWRDFYGLYEPLIKRFFQSRGLQEADADDIVQNVLQRVAKAAPYFEYDPAKGKFRSWLFTIARNELNRHFGKVMRRPASTSQPEVISNLVSADEAELRKSWETEYRQHLFQWACKRVRPETSDQAWKAFWGTAVDEKSATDVAAELDTTVGAIYIAKSRVIDKLRECIETVSGEWDLLDS